MNPYSNTLAFFCILCALAFKIFPAFSTRQFSTVSGSHRRHEPVAFGEDFAQKPLMLFVNLHDLRE